MRFDFASCEQCAKKLKEYKASMEQVYEELRALNTELLAASNKDVEELGNELRVELCKLDEELAKLNSVICALDGVILVWTNTEKLNLANAPGEIQRPEACPTGWETIYDILIRNSYHFIQIFR
ncbi:MAG: hypothetical protein IJD22_01465 [Clostridia bacterium]|nr:hypothetical protein [Clostridia bacterium]